jgi:hypothetical protein
MRPREVAEYLPEMVYLRGLSAQKNFHLIDIIYCMYAYKEEE